jgi:hypothetical protein
MPDFISRDKLRAELTKVYIDAFEAGNDPREACVGWLEMRGLEPIVVPGLSDGADPFCVATLASGRHFWFNPRSRTVEIGQPWPQRVSRNVLTAICSTLESTHPRNL